MLVIINGAFGVGKTTAVGILRQRLQRSTVLDPERIGYVLHRLPGFFPFSTRRLDDYQDSVFWRSMTVWLASRQARRRGIVLLPMCFVNLGYLNEIRSGVESRGCAVHHLCLTASADTIFSRLSRRGVVPDSDDGRWVYPRALKACSLHIRPEFAAQIPTDDHTPDEVADEIYLQIEKVAEPCARPNSR